jgi:hypothetical protein
MRNNVIVGTALTIVTIWWRRTRGAISIIGLSKHVRVLPRLIPA